MLSALILDIDGTLLDTNEAHVEVAVRRLGLSPAQCAMVDDTIYDAQACIAAGGVLAGESRMLVPESSSSGCTCGRATRC